MQIKTKGICKKKRRVLNLGSNLFLKSLYMKVTVLYNLDRGNSARQVEVASVRSGMEEKIAEVLTGKISPDLANAFPKIDIADTAIAPLLQKDVGMSNGLSLLNS